MERKLYQKWLLTTLKGFLFIIFGIIALFYPEITIGILAMFLGAFLMGGGIILTVASLRNRKFNSHWSFWLLEGIFDLLIGALVFFNPGISVAVFVGIIGIWAIITGVVLLISYYRVKKLIIKRRIILINSIMSLIFGILLLIYPFKSAVVISSIIGVFAIIYGIFFVLTSIKLTQA